MTGFTRKNPSSYWKLIFLFRMRQVSRVDRGGIFDCFDLTASVDYNGQSDEEDGKKYDVSGSFVCPIRKE
jgi:hypothetical protein